MRRIASVFARRDKEQPRPDPRRAHIVLTPLPTTPVLSSSSEHASSASSNGSTSIQTPDHDNEPDLVLSRTPTKRSWSTWLSRSKGTIKRTQRPPIPAPDEDWVDATPWRPTEAPILKPPPPPKSLLPAAADDSDEDASDSESEHDVDDDESPAVAPPSTSVAESSNYLECLILNARHIPVWTCSPFARPDGAPMYPRSSNSPRSLPVRDTMQTAIHKTLLLRRLRDTDVLTRAAQDSILPFASRHPPTLLDPPSLPWFHASAPPKTMKITETSPGLRTWFARRCFEERFAVWLPTPNGGVALRPVDSSAAVAELEYSAAIEAMIGLEPSPVADPPTVVVPPVAKNAQPPAAPSPLRNSALKPSVPPPVSPTESNASAPAVPHTTSRVRFAEDDKEDVIPLGYVLRLKKRREEKARFLREEQERRAFEEERTRQEDERRRRELERRQWEEEKRAWEREKRAIEEGRKKRLYAEEVAATRARREYQRAGGSYGVGNSMLASSSTTSLRDERHRSESGKISRPVHDQRRQASEPAVPQYGSTPSSSPHTSSPSSSRPPSIHQAGSVGRGSSRPPSVHSEDSRLATSTNAAKRSSVSSLHGKNPASDRSSIYSLWSTSNPALMPPVPPVPMYALDMPLLPPTPPFMLQQYPRPQSSNSRDSSPVRSSPGGSPSRQRLASSNSSLERLQPPQGHRSSSSSRRGSSSSSHRPEMTHQRRGSDDERRSSLPPPKDARGSLRSPSASSLARGRAALPPSSFQALSPSPWTAPPLMTSYSQQQLMSASPRTMPAAQRRQTTIS